MVGIRPVVVRVYVEDVLQERLAIVPAEVGYVALPYLAVPEPVRGYRELDRDKGYGAAPDVEAASVRQNVDHQLLAHRQRQELVEDYPLVVPAGQPLGLVEDRAGTRGATGQHFVYYRVVELQERQLELGDDQVLVVAGIADVRDVLAVPRNILRRLLVDEELDIVWRYSVVELWAGPASRSVDAVQVERGGAKVGNCRGVDLAQQAGSRVEGYVVVEELAQKGDPRSVVGVVRVIGVGGQRVRRSR